MNAAGAVHITSSRHESSIGRWTFHAAHSPRLAGLVDVVWHSAGLANTPRDCHVPLGTVELLVNLGDPFRLVEPTGAEVFAKTWLAGVQWGPVVTEQPRHHVVLGVRLRPAAAHALLGRPLSEVSGMVADLRELVGPTADELAERCGNCRTVAERLHVAEAWVAKRLTGARAVDPAIAWAAAEIERTGGAVSIEALRAETGFSKSRLVARFREQVGVAPKLYARIVRFRGALAMLARGAEPLADIAAAAGYYDQAHMTAEVRAMSGVTPGRLHLARDGIAVDGGVGEALAGRPGEAGRSARATELALPA
jgi:AraC-like DNA-binding protein